MSTEEYRIHFSSLWSIELLRLTPNEVLLYGYAADKEIDGGSSLETVL